MLTQSLIKVGVVLSLIFLAFTGLYMAFVPRPAEMQALNLSSSSVSANTPAQVQFTNAETYSAFQALNGYQEVMAIEPLPNGGDLIEFDPGDYRPEGPQPPFSDNRAVKVFVGSQVVNGVIQKIVEVRDAISGQVLARATWTWTSLKGFFDNWTGPAEVWSSKIEVLSSEAGQGVGLWLWKLSERLFAAPGVQRLVIDMSRTSTGEVDWTMRRLPEVLQFMKAIGLNPQVIQSWDSLKMWLIQY